jgi:F-type H+-transporting ATPase subunit delta
MNLLWLVAVAVALPETAVLATSIHLHRGVAHRSLEMHPAVGIVFRVILWLTTGQRSSREPRRLQVQRPIVGVRSVVVAHSGARGLAAADHRRGAGSAGRRLLVSWPEHERPRGVEPLKERRVAARYAKALFELAKERDGVGVVSRDLGVVAAICRDSPSLRGCFARPSLPRAAKRAAAADICRGAGLSKLTGDFLMLIAERGRAGLVGVMAEQDEQMLDADLGRVRARMRTAVPLTDDERLRLGAKLSTVLRADQVVLDEIADPTVLAGFVVENDTILIDGSLNGRLTAMRHRLVAG